MNDSQKFLKDRTINWYRSRIDPKIMRELVQRSDFQGFRLTLGHLGLCTTTGTLAYLLFLWMNRDNWLLSLPFLLVALFLHGTFSSFLGGTACHELMHRTPFKTKALNELFLRIFAFLGWWDYVWFRPSHIKHHQVTVHNDYDGEVVLPAKFTFKDWRFWLRLFGWDPLATWDTLMVYFKRATGHMDNEWYEFLMPEHDQKLRSKHLNWARYTLLGHAAIATLCITTGHWVLIVLINGRQYCGWLQFLCGQPQHFGLSPNVPDHRLCCRPFTCSWLPAFLYWNMQHHIELHMYPAVPFFNLPKLRGVIEQEMPPAPHGLLTTWKGLLEIHRRQQKDPDYVFIPNVPKPVDEENINRADDSILEQEAGLTQA